MKAVRRVGHNGMEGVVFLLLQPVEAVGMKECRPAEADRFPPFLRVEKLLLNAAIHSPLNGVQTAAFANETIGRVQTQIRTH